MSADISGERSGVVSGVMNMGCQIGGAVTASLTPYLAGRFGWNSAFIVAAVLSAAGGAPVAGGATPAASRHAVLSPDGPLRSLAMKIWLTYFQFRLILLVRVCGGTPEMKPNCSRRDFLGAMGMAAAGAAIARPHLLRRCRRRQAASPSAFARNTTGRLSTRFPPCSTSLAVWTGLVRGKTVAIKLNMTGPPNDKLNSMPNQMTHWVHPQVIGSLVSLLGKAGAQRIRLLESAPVGTKPLEEFMISAGWQPKDFASAATRVEFENTNFLGSGKTYARFMVPGGGLMYAGYDLNHSYRDSDVFVSLAKLKEHRTAGVTLSMKNCFGITPCTIYSDDAPEDEPSIVPVGYRGPMHSGSRVPPKSAPQPVNDRMSKDPGYRVPRITADLVARPGRFISRSSTASTP